MKQQKLLSKLFVGVLILILSSEVLQAATPDFYKCNDRVSGEWNYARAPYACNSNSFGEDRQVFRDYAPVIFEDNVERTAERLRYMDELSAVIRDAATYYLQKRKPNVSSTELSWWVLAIHSTVSNESYWSHYRIASDKKLKIMRGDSGHGHGMMQIDDRAHFNAVDQGIAWNMASALVYGMDIFYSAWQKAPSQSCVGSETNYEARVRAAWAAYNGGSSKLCRWTNPNDRWAQNDQNFYHHFRNRMWTNYVKNPNKAAGINVPCLIENRENCALPGNEVTTLEPGFLYQNAQGHTCTLIQGQAHCVNEFKDSICLNAYARFDASRSYQVKDEVLTNYQPVYWDRHQICHQFEDSLYKVGSTIEVGKNINLRATPGGGILTVVPKGTYTGVIDFEIRNFPTNDRYYKITYKGHTGYLYAGTSKDFADWAIQINESNSLLAQVGQRVRITNPAGINLRETAAGKLIRLIPTKTELTVLGVVTHQSDNKNYYKVQYNGQTGWIYTGLLIPTNTTSQWTEVLR